MSFSYNPSELSTSPIYQVRLQIGQTNEYSPVVVQDEEIQYFLDQNFQVVKNAALDVLNSQISMAASLVDKETGQISEAQSQILKNLKILRDDLLNSVSRNTPTYMAITGIDNVDRDDIDNDETIYQDGVKMNTRGVSKLLFGDDTGVY